MSKREILRAQLITAHQELQESEEQVEVWREGLIFLRQEEGGEEIEVCLCFNPVAICDCYSFWDREEQEMASVGTDFGWPVSGSGVPGLFGDHRFQFGHFGHF